MYKFILGFFFLSLNRKRTQKSFSIAGACFVADHCRLFALSDCKDPAFYDDAKHSHDDC